MFIMVAIIYKNSKLYGYRIVNYIENQKQHEIKDCSIDQIKLAFSRGAKIDNLVLKNKKIVITKGIESNYIKIDVEDTENKNTNKLRFGYLIKKDNGAEIIDYCGDIFEYSASEVIVIKNYYMIPNLCDYYEKYTGEQLLVEPPKGVINATLADNEKIEAKVINNYTTENKKIRLKHFIDNKVKYIDKDMYKAPVISGYIIGSVSVRIEIDLINKYRGLVDLIDVDSIIKNKVQLGERKIEYQDNIFNKIYSSPDNLEQYNKMRDYLCANKFVRICFTYNETEPIALCRNISKKGIKYRMNIGNRTYSEDIEMIYYNISRNICKYQNIIARDNVLIVYALDGVIAYNMDRIHNEYSGKIRDSERSIANRLIGIKSTEIINERNEVIKVETCSENIILDDHITKLLRNSVIVNAQYNKRIIIGENIRECKRAFIFVGSRDEFTELQIIVKCKITEELFTELRDYRKKIDLCNQELESTILQKIPVIAYAHNYRLRVSEFQKLIDKYYTSKQSSIRYLLKVTNMTTEEVLKCSKPRETFLFIK